MRKLLLVFTFCISANLIFGQKDSRIFNDTIWTYRIEKYQNRLPLIDSTSIFIGADNSPVVCLDKKTGKENWKLNVTIAEYRKGFVHTIRDDKRGNIYFHGSSKDVFAVRKNNGEVLWKYESIFDDDIYSRITILENTIYINPADSFFLAISTNGKLLWKTNLPSVCSGYEIDGNEILCQTTNGICILNRTNGKIVTTKKVFDNIPYYTFPPICLNEFLLVGNSRDSLACLNRKSFKREWTLTNVKNIWKEDNSVYVYNDTAFWKININSGQSEWSIKGDFNWPIQPTEYRGNLYLQTRYRFLILDSKSGKLLFESPFPFKSYTKPLIDNDTIYIGFTSNYIAVKNPIYKEVVH